MVAEKKKNTLLFVSGFLGWAVIFVSVASLMSCSSQPQGDVVSIQVQDQEDSHARSVVGVEIAKPFREDLLRRITIPAEFEAFKETTIHSKVSGYLEWIKVDIGDRVKKGKVIAKLEVPEMLSQYKEAEAERDGVKADLENAQAELESARANYELGEITYKRLQAIRETEPDVMSQQTVDEAKAKFRVAEATVKVVKSRIKQVLSKIKQSEAILHRVQTLMAYAEIKAPFSGVVTARFVDEGALIQAATTSRDVQPIITLASMDRLRLFLDVPESEVPFVQVGDASVITVDALPGKKFEGQVTRFATALNPSTRTMKTQIDISNPQRLLRPGMFGRVTLLLEERPRAISIPAEALQVEGDREFVYCVVDSIARKVQVKTGFTDGIKIEVKKGLDGSENVVVATRGFLTEGRKVNVIRSEARKE